MALVVDVPDCDIFEQWSQQYNHLGSQLNYEMRANQNLPCTQVCEGVLVNRPQCI